jgi:predicted O-methyltransferase YrrM
MYSATQIGIKYLRYYWNAANGKGHGIHSPFVFEFVTEVLNNKGEYYDFGKIESARTSFLNNDRVIEVKDLGAGSTGNNSGRRMVRDIAKRALKSPKYASLLFRIVNHYQPQNILELGTSLGITSSYLAAANRSARLLTLEGVPAIASVAKDYFRESDLSNIELVEGNFDDTLPVALRSLGRVDLAYIDGNHRYAPTIKYFEEILEYSHDYSILILDDIHWSKEMEQAWDHCRADARVRLSIDLFFIGLLFFRKEFKVKQDFVIRF